MMNKHIRFAAVTILLISPVVLSAQSPALKPYVYAEDGFVISAPSEPVLEKKPQDTAKGRVENHSYTVEMANDVAFVLFVTDFKGATGLSLQGGRDGFLGSMKARLLTEKAITLAGSPGIGFDYESATSHGHAQMFVVRGVMVQLLSVAPLNLPLPGVIDSMFRSFRFLESAH